MRNFKRWGMLLVMTIFLMGGTVWFNCTSNDSDSVLYVRAAAVYEGEADNRFFFTKTCLAGASSFVGDPVLMGHNWVDPNAAVGVIVNAQLKYDSSLKSHYIEMVFKITDNYAVHKIKQGLFNKLSIGFTINRMVCSICSNDMKHCAHSPGQYYKVGCTNVLARGLVINMIGQEVSFVNVPASANARVLEWSHKSFVVRK